MISDTLLILTGGGASTRFNRPGGKLLAMLGNLPVYAHSLKTLAPLLAPDRICMTVPADQIELFRETTKQLFPGLSVRFAAGGATRAESVRNALELYADESWVKYAAIHDAARPLITAEDFLHCLEVCRRTGGAMLAHRITDTVKRAKAGTGELKETVSRTDLWGAETPQMFDFRILLDCFRRMPCGTAVTDDAQIVELFGGKLAVQAVESTSLNIKITYQPDIALCELLLSARRM